MNSRRMSALAGLLALLALAAAIASLWFAPYAFWQFLGTSLLLLIAAVFTAALGKGSAR